MKKYFFVALAALTLSLSAEAQTIKTPAASTTATIKQEFALSSIDITYSRPNMKGRTIFGDLVPYGKMWRTGANGATKVKFGEDVKVGGMALKAGEYALYTVPNKDFWEIVFNKGINNGGLTGYKAEEDVVRFAVKPIAMPMAMESFTIMINDIMPNSALIQLFWDRTLVAFKVEADVDTQVMKSIDQVMNNDTKPYFAAASYYFEAGKDMNKALAWANKATESNPKAYWMMHLKAKIQAKMGDAKGAKETALKSIELAKEGKNDDYVALNEKLIATLK